MEDRVTRKHLHEVERDAMLHVQDVKSVPELQVLYAGVQVISTSRLFHGRDPAVAKALSPTSTRRMVILARSA
jgi:hypothetical protein